MHSSALGKSVAGDTFLRSVSGHASPEGGFQVIPESSFVINHAARLWEYMSSGRARAAAEAVVICCSYDLRVCDYACSLIQSGIAPLLVISGNTGNWTKHLWTRPECEVFKDRALSKGIDSSRILLERDSTNFGENIAFVRRLLPHLTRVVFVTKPAAILRVSLTIPVQWPGISAFVDAPVLAFPQDVSNIIGVLGAIDEMVGDIDRVIRYPSRGFQISHNLPADILDSWNALKAAGFNRHLISN